MSHEDRGPSVGLSLGGKALKIAQAIDPAQLVQQNGLYVLLQHLQYYLGAEEQDKQRYAYKEFQRYRRPRNLSASEHILEFERLYSECVKFGQFLPRVTLSMRLLETAGLTEHQESWCLQTVGGNFEMYDQLRLALKRCPGLDIRRTDPSHYPVLNPEQKEFEHRPFNFDQGHLNRAPPGPPPLMQEEQQLYPIDEEYSDSESDDDYCSTTPTGAAEEDQNGLVSIFAVMQGNAQFSRRPEESASTAKANAELRKSGPWTTNAICKMTLLRAGQKKSG